MLCNLVIDRPKAVGRSLVKSQSCVLSIDVKIVSQLKCQSLERQVGQGFRYSKYGFPMDYGWAAMALSWNHHQQNLIRVVTGRQNVLSIFDPENGTPGDQVPHYPTAGTLVASDDCGWRQSQMMNLLLLPQADIHSVHPKQGPARPKVSMH